MGTLKTFCVGIDQNFIGIETMPVFRVIETMHPVSIKATGVQLFQVNMPDMAGGLYQRNADAFFFRVQGGEQAQLDTGCVFAEQSKIDAPAIPGGAQWIWFSFRPPHHFYFRRDGGVSQGK